MQTINICQLNRRYNGTMEGVSQNSAIIEHIETTEEKTFTRIL